MAEYVTGQRERRRVAVVGSGVAGLTAAHVFASAGRHVTLYEADHRLGGHADTHLVDVGGRIVPVDTGFIVHNDRTYPTLLRLFAELGVETRDSDMSMSIRVDGTPDQRGIEYAGALGARGLFPSVRNLLDLAYLRMLTEVKRFHRHATEILASPVDPEGDEETLRAFVARVGLSEYFTTRFLRPLVAAVWSCDPARALDYPARYLFAFLDHHGFLVLNDTPTWHTVVGGSRSYVGAITSQLDVVRTRTRVTAVSRKPDAVEIDDELGAHHAFDKVVLATHSDDALALLTDAGEDEQEVLGAFVYSRNVTHLHRDESVLPARRTGRASWNYRLEGCRTVTDRSRVSYWMNRLQGHPESDPLVVTLNPGDGETPSDVVATMTYLHPTYTAASVAAQRRLAGLNSDRLAFAGAYHGWGFHEDGCLSGVNAAAALGVEW